jgi:hypothetical protein
MSSYPERLKIRPLVPKLSHSAAFTFIPVSFYKYKRNLNITLKKLQTYFNTGTVKLGYNEHAWDRLILFVIAVICYNREDLCTKVAIWDQKFQL